MSTLPLPAVVAVFALAAIAVWFAGIRLSDTTDVLATRLGLGEALGGLILLAIATNLPEIAITVSASLANNLGLAIGNILGGVAIQTVVLALIDAIGLGREDGLTFRSASLSLVLEAMVVIAVLVITVMGAQLPLGPANGARARGGLHCRDVDRRPVAGRPVRAAACHGTRWGTARRAGAPPGHARKKRAARRSGGWDASRRRGVRRRGARDLVAASPSSRAVR